MVFLRSIFDEVSTMDVVIEKIMVGSSVFSCTIYVLLTSPTYLPRLFNVLFQKHGSVLYSKSSRERRSAESEKFPFPRLSSTRKYLIRLFCLIYSCYYFRLSPKG